MPNTPEQRKALKKRCTLIVPGFKASTPAEEFEQMAAWCKANAIEHDHYGEGEVVEAFEKKIAALLGKPAAVLMTSGVTAQLAAVRIHAETARLDRFGMHPTSHLASHEDESYAALMRMHGVPIGDRLRPMTATDLEAIAQPLGCAIVELPIREAGGQLPTWDELDALKAAAAAREMPLHMDGARLWESAAYYGKSYEEIANGFASVYVSLYKGVGAFAGAMLTGDEAFIAQARVWRRRMGGTLHHMSPFVASAAMRFDQRIASMPALYERALWFASMLAKQPALRVNPAVPQSNMLHIYFAATADAVMEARDALAETTGTWLIDRVRPAEVPGWSVTELYVGDQLLHADDDAIAASFVRLCEAIAST
jgi:threonine aldolase